MNTFNIDEILSLARKDTSLVIDYMKNEIPNTFVPMRELIGKFGSNARSHVKKLEGTNTFRIARLDPNSNARKETEMWIMVVAELLTKEQVDTLTLLLRSEKDEYSDVSFEVSEQPVVEEIEVIQPVVELEVSEETEETERTFSDEQLRESFAYNRSLKEYVCQTCSVEVPKDNRVSHLIATH